MMDSGSTDERRESPRGRRGRHGRIDVQWFRQSAEERHGLDAALSQHFAL
jgi:hypothetical protein